MFRIINLSDYIYCQGIQDFLLVSWKNQAHLFLLLTFRMQQMHKQSCL